MGPPPWEMLIHSLNGHPGEMRDPAQPRSGPMGQADKVHGRVKPLDNLAMGTLSVQSREENSHLRQLCRGSWRMQVSGYKPPERPVEILLGGGH